jgi:hypothetical protein
MTTRSNTNFRCRRFIVSPLTTGAASRLNS